MSILGKKALLGLLVPLAKDVLPKLATKATSSALDKFKKKINGARAVRAGKGFTSFISNEDMDDILKIEESPEESGRFIDGETETVKHEIKKQEGQFIGAMMIPWAASLISLLPCPLITKYYIWKMSHKGRKRRRRRNSSIITITFNNESSGKMSLKGRKGI